MAFNFYDTLKKSNASQFCSLDGFFQHKRINQQKIVNEGYLGNQDVYAVVSRMARLCATTPILVLKNGKAVTAEDDEFANFFYNRWNGNSGSNEGLNALYINLFLFGLAYDYAPVSSVGFLPSEQWVLPTQRVEPIVNNASFFESVEYYEFLDTSEIKKIEPEELVIIKYYDPQNTDRTQDGLSPFQASWNTVESENNRGEAENSLLKNRGISGFVSPKASSESYGLIGAAADAARKVFAKLTGGADKFNKIETIETPVEFTQVGMDSNDLKIVESRLNHVRDICNALGVPSLLFNDYQSRTHANYGEAKKSLYTDFVIPQVELFIDQYTRGFIEKVNEKQEGNVYTLEIDLNNITVLNPSPEEIRKEATSLYEKGLLTKAETREAINMPVDMEEDNQTTLEILLRMNPATTNNLINSLTEEERTALSNQILGLNK